jgi:quercetin dioxygenase-like cupin family protein
MPIQTTPVHTRADAETIAFLGEVLAVRLTSEQTNGEVGVLVHLLPAGTAAPMHVQPHESELFYVIDGRITVWLDGEFHRGRERRRRMAAPRVRTRIPR